jgi:Pro-kumamolisin, activation domain/Divergent InlB B-repeat domain/Glucodextranase, domain B
MHPEFKGSKAASGRWKSICAGMLVFCGSFWTSDPLLAQNGRQTLHGHVPAIVKNLRPLGRISAKRQLNLVIGLPLRNPEALTNLLHQIYDPASPNFRQFLTPEQFTQMFGPTEQDYEALIAFAKSQGLTVSRRHSNRMLLGVHGPVADIEKAFQVTLRLYQHPTEKRRFFATDVEPSVPSGLRVLDISGLSDYGRPHPKYKLKPANALPTPKTGSGPGGNYMGLDFRAAYAPGVSLTGAGQTVALVQFDGYLASDIAAYAAQAGLPTVSLQNVLLNGFDGLPTGNGGEVEVSLDIEMVISMAPGLSKVIVYEGDPYNFFPNTVLNRIATDNSARQISCSWGWVGGPNATTEQIFLQMAAQGQSFFNASGDDDAFLPGQVDDPSYFGTPSASPNITQVGGTTLTTTGPQGSWSSETVWNWGGGVGSSGGISTYYGIPTWQQGIDMTANKGSTSNRNIPDVALTADDIFVIADGGVHYGGVGGTSVAAPLWAGFTALVNQQAAQTESPPVGFINPAIYALGKGPDYTSDFHDVTTGNNEWFGSPTLFSAVAGYDLCTGWGTPVGQNLIYALTSSGGVPDGILELSVVPFNGATLLAGSTEKVFVQVTDVRPVTNATVTAIINGGSSLVFSNNGVAPDVKSNDAIYSANVPVPLNTNSLTLNFLITAPGKTNSTDVVTYGVVPVPVNDYFTNAAKVPPGGAVYLSNNKFATVEPGEPKHAGVSTCAGSLWWNWSPSTTTNVFIDTTGSEIDSVLAVYTGSSVSNLTQVAATNDVGMSQQAYLNLNVTGGASYRIVVASGSSNSLGSLRLLIAPGGQRDTNAPAVFVTSPPSGLWVTNFLITVTGTASDPQPNASGLKRVLLNLRGQTYTVTGTTNWTYTFGLGPGLNTIKVTAEDLAGNVSAPVTIDITRVIINPINDLFANAIPLSGNTGVVTVATTNATKEFGEPDHAGNAGGKSVWWSFTAPDDGVLTLSTTNSSFDTLLGLYTGSKVSQLTTVASNDDAYAGAPGGFSQIVQAVRSNQTYHIAVDGFDGVGGNAVLSYSFAPATVYHLVTSSTTGGSVFPGPGDYAGGSTVMVTATPDQFFDFANWSGGSAAVANPLSIVVNSNVTLTANFQPIVYSDDFETGNLLQLPWATSGNLPWVVQTDVVLAGQYAARSGAIGDSQTSSLILSTNFVGGIASFYFKVSSELNWDFLSFYVDGVLQQKWSGEVDWTSYAFPLSAGAHTLVWSYTKDSSGSAGLDAAFLDDVNLPLALPINASSAASLNILRQSDGSLLIQVLGQTNQQYIIQGTTNLTQPIHWENLSTNMAAGGVINFPATPTDPLRFFRAVVPVP